MLLPKTLREEIGDRAARAAVLENKPLPSEAREMLIYLALCDALQEARKQARRRMAA